jgi:hypothetical protein
VNVAAANRSAAPVATNARLMFILLLSRPPPSANRVQCVENTPDVGVGLRGVGGESFHQPRRMPSSAANAT